jgi:hypothetical protein
LDEKAFDYRFILQLMRSIDQSIHLAAKNDLTSVSSFGKHFEFPPINSVFLDLVHDVDRLGMKCIIEGPEVVPSRRIIRVLEFAVLGIAEQIRSHNSGGWCEAIELYRALLSIADLRNDIQWTSDGLELVRRNLIPMFYVQCSERLSLRFCSGERKTHILVLSRLKDGFINNSVSGIKSRSHDLLDAIFASQQHDLVQVGSVHCEKVEFLSSPSVNALYLEPHDWEVFAKSPTDWIDMKRYQDTLDIHWKGMFEDPTTRSSAMIAVMCLIWLLQRLSHFSTEIGHVIFHAFELVMKDAEVNTFADSGGEVFIQQMLQPNITQM